MQNMGQWNPRVEAAGRGGLAALGLVNDGFLLRVEGDPVDLGIGLRWDQATPEASAWRFEEPLPGEHHYLIGEVAASHQLAFRAARLESAAGALLVESRPDGRWSVEAEGGALGLELVGATSPGLTAGGALILEADEQRWSLAPPLWGQSNQARWTVVSPTGVALSRGQASPEIAAGVQSSASIDWSTFLGAPFSGEQGRGADYDSLGRPVTCGLTFSTEFPTAVGPVLSAPGGIVDGFLTKLTADGSELVFSTYIGGSKPDYVVAVDLASNDEIAMLGLSQSPGWPITPGAYDDTVQANGPEYAMTVTRMQPDGSAPIFSTFFGDDLFDGFPRYFTIAKDDGTILLCGDEGGVPYTSNTAFGAGNGGSFLAKFSADGSDLIFSTSPPCDPFMAELSDGSIVVAGDGGNAGWGLPNSFQPQPGGNASFDCWVGVVSADGRDLMASTYLGGVKTDSSRGVGVDAEDNIYTCGTTQSPGFPVTGSPFGGTIFPNAPGFVAKFDRDLSELQWTALFGTGPDYANAQISWEALRSDRSGVVTVVGWATGGAPTFGTPGAYDLVNPFGYGGRVLRLSPNGDRVLYSTALELSEPALSGIRPPALGENPRVALLNGTVNGSPNLYPTTAGAFKNTCEASCLNEAYLTQFSFFHEGVEALGEGASSCLGVIPLNTSRRADVGAEGFAFYVSQAPPGSVGVMLLGSATLLPIPIEGQSLWVDPATLLPLQLFTTQETGYGELELVIPPAAVGKTFAAQAAVLGTSSCGPEGQFVVSEAVTVSVP